MPKLRPDEEINLKHYFNAVAEKIRAIILSELDNNQRIQEALADLGSLGIVVQVETNFNIQCYVQDTFKPPSSEQEIDRKLPSDDDIAKWLRGSSD